MSQPSGAALTPAERRVVAWLAAIYATRLLGLFLLLPVLALHVTALPGGTALLAGLAVGAYGFTQALLQVPFGAWSDRIGRRPLIAVGLVLHVAGSAIGALASSAWGVVAARVVQGLGAVSGPVTALVADSTRPAARTRAMFAIGISIGASFIVALVAGPLLAAAVGVPGLFALVGVLGLGALAVVAFALPEAQARPASRAPHAWRDAFTRALAPHHSGVFMLHFTLTATFIAVPMALRDLQGIDAARHSLVYLGVFAASLPLTVAFVLASERRPGPGVALAGALLLAAALVALGCFPGRFWATAAALTAYFGTFNFLEARLPAALTEAAGEGGRGAALGVFATCQFAGAFAGGLAGGVLLEAGAGVAGVLGAAAVAAGSWLAWRALAEIRRSPPNRAARAGGRRLQ